MGLILGTALALGACPQEPALTVEVCSDMRAPDEIDGVRLVLLDDAHDRELWSGFYSLINCEENRVEQLPQRYDAPALSRPVWLVASGLLDGVEVVRVETRVKGPLPGGLTVVPVSLVRDCLGQLSCPLGQTCVGPSGCEVVPVFEEAPMACAAPPEPDVPDAGGLADAPDDDAPNAEDVEDAEDAGPVPLCPPPAGMGGA